MSVPAIREQINVILSGVPGIGVLHDRERFANEWGKFLNLFKDADGRINGCMFSRESRRRVQTTMGETEKAHVFVVRRFLAVKDSDETGIIFDDHLEVLADAFDGDDNETLNGTCRTINPDWGPMEGAIGLQIEISELRMVGTVLCHYAECKLCVIEAKEN
jgi:hypothetical protein